jgi:UDP-N-acetyl-D-mannosaminuronate dehydrogenase
VALADIRVAVLGRTFKRDSDDERQSPSARLIELLQRSGAEVAAHDPFLSGPPLAETLQGAGAFVLATNHTFYETIDPVEVASLLREPRVGLDCWAMLDRSAFARAGIRIITFGVGEEL